MAVLVFRLSSDDAADVMRAVVEVQAGAERAGYSLPDGESSPAAALARVCREWAGGRRWGEAGDCPNGIHAYQRSAFTLIELLVVIAIIAIPLTAACCFF